MKLSNPHWPKSQLGPWQYFRQSSKPKCIQTRNHLSGNATNSITNKWTPQHFLWITFFCDRKCHLHKWTSYGSSGRSAKGKMTIHRAPFYKLGGWGSLSPTINGNLHDFHNKMGATLRPGTTCPRSPPHLQAQDPGLGCPLPPQAFATATHAFGKKSVLKIAPLKQNVIKRQAHEKY